MQRAQFRQLNAPSQTGQWERKRVSGSPDGSQRDRQLSRKRHTEKKGVIYINCNATSWYSLMIHPKDMLSQHQTRCHGRDVKYLETSFNIVACEDPL